MEQVIITATKEGEVSVKVECVKGSTCMETSAAIEKALGATSSNEQTSEYHERGTNANIAHKH